MKSKDLYSFSPSLVALILRWSKAVATGNTNFLSRNSVPDDNMYLTHGMSCGFSFCFFVLT